MNGERGQPFVPGLTLAERFFHQEVEPTLGSRFPGLHYSAALIGTGSEVLGFDTEMSSDHHWGPRVMLFLNAVDLSSKREAIREILSDALPTTFMGYSTNFSEPNPDDNGVQLMQPIDSGPVSHRVEMHTLDGFFLHYLGVDLSKELDPADWLILPQHRLRSATAGRVFRDELGLDRIRARFSSYPHDVWLYVLASGWRRIGQEEHLMGRAGYVGDEIGSAILGSRLVRDIVRLAYLMEKEHPPYAKWLGTAFSRLKAAAELKPSLDGAVHATSWEGREASLCRAYEILVAIHNSLGITDPLPSRAEPFWSRPFRIIHGDRIAEAIAGSIKDPKVKPLVRRSLIGNIDMVSDNTDFLEDESFRKAMRALYV